MSSNRAHMASAPTLLARTAVTLIGVAGLAAATLLVAPPASSAQSSARDHHALGKTAAERTETLQQRIRTLHAGLHITPAEEARWSGVAQVMRDNENRLQAMITARQAEPVHHVTAPEDLRMIEHFTRAHADGLKALHTAFETLYAVMPGDQKLIADEIFDKFGNRHEG